ncbi:MAG: TlpA family protein disulfide reductase [Treponema sp.]|jgi:thiol-disulfide isomerase/thioredoxin|nr:TlpA family protein disulfide reductase [Treponema sp.]
MNIPKRYLCAFALLAQSLCLFAQAGAETARPGLRAAFAKAGIPLLETALSPADFEVTTLSGEKVRLSSLAGSYVFLNFWATWCPPCRSEMPSMEALYKRFKVRGLRFLAVDIQENREAAARFASRYQFSFPIGLDLSGSISEAYAIKAIPATFILNKEGRIIARVTGSLDWSAPAVLAAFETLLGSDG